MRILLVDTVSSGHHISYLNALLSISDQVAVVAPLDSRIEALIQYSIDYRKNGKPQYTKWLRKIKRVINQYKPDIVHFVYGDDLYRFMAFGLRRICKNCKVVITCHQIRRSIMRDISLRLIGKQADLVVVHTQQLKKDLEAMGINNVGQIEYPYFSDSDMIGQTEALHTLGLDNVNRPVILALGGTRKDKGVDLLIDALSFVKTSFHLIIAGKEEFFKKEFIEKKIQSYKNNVTLRLEYLSKNDFTLYLNAADIVCLPYRKIFNGASGPLGEGVALDKMIVGANHGSLGQIIETNHLGYTFESENIGVLTETLEKALSTEWVPDEKYLAYKELMSPKRFQREYLELYTNILKG